MSKSRKTSTHPKRKTKKSVKAVKKEYPEFIQIFEKELLEKTPFIIKADQYTGESSYHVGVLQKQGKRHHCIWMVGFATTLQELNRFWDSTCYKEWKQNST
jgi:hypothetical protein